MHAWQYLFIFCFSQHRLAFNYEATNWSLNNRYWKKTIALLVKLHLPKKRWWVFFFSYLEIPLSKHNKLFAFFKTQYLSRQTNGFFCRPTLPSRSILQPFQEFQQRKILFQAPDTRISYFWGRVKWRGGEEEKPQANTIMRSSTNHSWDSDKY